MMDRYEIAKLWSKLSHEGLTNDSLEVFTDKVVKGEESWKEILNIEAKEEAETAGFLREAIVAKKIINLIIDENLNHGQTYFILKGVFDSFKLKYKEHLAEYIGEEND